MGKTLGISEALTRMTVAKGDYVKHPERPAWGLGRVIEVTSFSTARIFFNHTGEKEISLKHVDLKPARPAKKNFRELRERIKLTQGLSVFCVYTIVSGKRLAKQFARGRGATYSEGKRWVTGYVLWKEAQAERKCFPILFGDAANCSRLLYWAPLTKIRLDGSSTTYTIGRLRRFTGKRSPQELRLRRSQEKIAPMFIRPYAICLTPAFLALSST